MPNQILSGYLHKRAIRNGRTWKRRFFVLTEVMLSYYKTDADALGNAKSRGDFPINAQTTIMASDAKEFGMEIITDNPPVSLVIAADSQKEYTQWFETIEKLIEVAKKAPTPLDTSHGLPEIPQNTNNSDSSGGLGIFKKIIRGRRGSNISTTSMEDLEGNLK